MFYTRKFTNIIWWTLYLLSNCTIGFGNFEEEIVNYRYKDPKVLFDLLTREDAKQKAKSATEVPQTIIDVDAFKNVKTYYDSPKQIFPGYFNPIIYKNVHTLLNELEPDQVKQSEPYEKEDYYRQMQKKIHAKYTDQRYHIAKIAPSGDYHLLPRTGNAALKLVKLKSKLRRAPNSFKVKRHRRLKKNLNYYYQQGNH